MPTHYQHHWKVGHVEGTDDNSLPTYRYLFRCEVCDEHVDADLALLDANFPHLPKCKGPKTYSRGDLVCGDCGSTVFDVAKGDHLHAPDCIRIARSVTHDAEPNPNK